MLASKGRVERLQRRAFSRLCSHCSRPSRRLSGPPSHVSSPLPYPYSVIGMVMIAFVGRSHAQQTWDGCHLDPPGGHLGKPQAPVEERHTGSFLLLLRFLRSCVRRLCVHTRFSACGVMTYRTAGIQVALSIDPLHRSKEGLVGGPLCMVEWSRGRGAYCCSCFVHGRL
jgi:hypothetical protein